jgi:hypothetical protein
LSDTPINAVLLLQAHLFFYSQIHFLGELEASASMAGAGLPGLILASGGLLA